MLWFLQIEGRTQQNDCHSLYCRELEPNPHCLWGTPVDEGHWWGQYRENLVIMPESPNYTFQVGPLPQSIKFIFIFKRFYLFIFRERGKEGKKHQCVRETWIGCLSHAHNWGPGPQPRHVPWLGIELATFWFTESALNQSTEPHQPRQSIMFTLFFSIILGSPSSSFFYFSLFFSILPAPRIALCPDGKAFCASPGSSQVLVPGILYIPCSISVVLNHIYLF